MNDRYKRDHWVIRLTPATARLIVTLMSDKTLEIHAERCKDHYGDYTPRPSARAATCARSHAPLWISQWIESGMVIGKRRAHLKLPKDNERLIRFAEGLADWASNYKKVGRYSRFFRQAATEIHKLATNHPLEILAEALENL